MSSVTAKFFPVDDNTGYLQLLIVVDDETKEELGNMNEGLASLAGLQYLYAVGVLNFGGEDKVNEILKQMVRPEEEDA